MESKTAFGVICSLFYVYLLFLRNSSPSKGQEIAAFFLYISDLMSHCFSCSNKSPFPPSQCEIGQTSLSGAECNGWEGKSHTLRLLFCTFLSFYFAAHEEVVLVIAQTTKSRGGAVA